MDQTKIWDYYQNNEEIGNTFANARLRYAFIARQIIPGMNVLNIGVGRGGLEAMLLKKGVCVSCLDPSEMAIKDLRDQYGLANRAQVGFSQSIPFADRQFDVVVMSEVLEHLADTMLHATLREVKRVLKPDGRFIGTVPADENLLENRVMCPHCGEPFHRWGHLQSFSEGQLGVVLSQQFGNVKLSRRYFGDVRKFNWKGRLNWGLKKILLGLGIKGRDENLFFSASN